MGMPVPSMPRYSVGGMSRSVSGSMTRCSARVLRDFAAETLGFTLDVLDRNLNAGELVQQLVAFLEAHARADDADHS
jgi:hypothetical protein